MNLALLCDFYELTMSNGYFKNGLSDTICHFDIFFRKVPDKASFIIVAGLQTIISYIENFHFDESDIAYLRKQNLFDEDFLSFLKNLRFTGDINAMQEGEIAFPHEPIISVKAKASEAQILETFLLLALNHQSLVATKANRVVRAAGQKPVLEFGSRRAQGIDAAINGARAAFIGGAKATACTLAGKKFGISVAGTMAHSWVQMFEDELEAFKSYCKLYPQNTVLLVDTYDTINGVKNAINAFKSVFKDSLPENFGIRLDSGNLYELSKKARIMLDTAGLNRCKILASGALDELEIQKLTQNEAPIDAYGVGEKLITSKSSPVLGCVYKLVATQTNSTIIPKIKISENKEKISNPHAKKLYRIFDKESKKALYDELCLQDEPLNLTTNSYAKELLVPIFKAGKLVYEMPSLKQIQSYASSQISCLDEEFLKLNEAKTYTVKLSDKLLTLKNTMLAKAKQ